MSDAPTMLDWTQGTDGLAYQRCAACAAAWYFARTFCPRCGGEPKRWQAGGLGTVHALTEVTRAPSDELRAYAPYVIVLVDADEGFRLMAHGERGLSIGTRVLCRFIDFAGRRIPFFERTQI